MFCSRLAFRHSFHCSVWMFSGVSRLVVNRLDPVLLRPHPGTRAPSLLRHYPVSTVLRAPPPPAPARRPRRLLTTPSWSPKWASRVARRSLLTCCHPPPRRSRPGSSSSASRSIAAFPQSRQGRPSHRDFRGRLGVHACYSLPTCRRPFAAFCLPGFDHFVTSVAAGIATRPGRPLPGQDFHLLEQRTFTAHLDQHRQHSQSDTLVSRPDVNAMAHASNLQFPFRTASARPGD